ncbi:hypothetical protein GL50803_008528 [Giardia duodenalis]|uniref:Uncharacterized protein n=1 Tax=Giardia intestinalis (strain ATCC 50803 / WB clone C6) TaxID=184922 RepID=A8BKM6_GIAIC|nr:hypothetical protein GL50803_008528 [Giardia intestinalis]KAE8301461.1 hypothetical protein GL50803_008528 [Giardia intestinalis]|eukprot:XP_001706561.1 Hypothetical protein GL50803_8528 [Giardia lamblia ATCC 50803]
MGQSPSKLAPPPFLALPVPGVRFTGPNGTTCTWADLYAHCSIRAQKAVLDAFNMKYREKVVHWHGTLLNADPSTNSVLFKMSPSINQGAVPDLALHFPQSFTVTQLQPLIKMNEMKTIDFVGKLRGMNGPVIAADYVSVGGGYVEKPEHNLPKTVADALHAIPEAFPSLAALESQLTVEYPMVAMECSMQARGLPEAIFMRHITKVAGALSCQVIEVSPQNAKVKCNPRIDEKAPFDVLVTFQPAMAAKLPEVKQGALCTFRGKYTSISTAREPQKVFGFAADDVVLNKDPAASLASLPTKGGDVFYQGQDEVVMKNLRAQVESDRQLHKSMRGGAHAQTPASAPTPAPPAPSEPASSSAGHKPADDKPVEEPPAEASKPAEPTPKVEEVKPPVIEETVSDVAGKDPLEVALTLMQSAPEASYTVKKSILDADEQEDDPVARMARLKMGGFNASAFTSSADKYMGELDMLAGVKPTQQSDYDVYDVANDYNNTNNYDSYNSGYDNYNSGYDNYSSGGYNSYGGGYSSW